MRRSLVPFLRLPGLLLALLALAGQLAVGAMAPADARVDAQLSELAAAMGQCRSPAPGEPAPDTHHRRLPDCAPATTAARLALPALAMAPAPVLPDPPASVAIRLAAPPSARAPPSHRSHVGYPRGPPVLS